MKRARSRLSVSEERVASCFAHRGCCLRDDELEAQLGPEPYDEAMRSLAAVGRLVRAERTGQWVSIPEHVSERMSLMTEERKERHLRVLLLEVVGGGNQGVTKKALKRSKLAANLVEDGLKRLAECELVRSQKPPREREVVFLPKWVAIAPELQADVWFDPALKGFDGRLIEILLGLLCGACRCDGGIKPWADVEAAFAPRRDQTLRALAPDRVARFTPQHSEQLVRFLVAEGSVLQLATGLCLLQGGLDRIARGKVVASSISKGLEVPPSERALVGAALGVFSSPCTQCPDRGVCSPTGPINPSTCEPLGKWLTDW